mgnify:CR=1 FL=1
MASTPSPYAVKNSGKSWEVWDLNANEVLATFDSWRDAETCQSACELARRDAQAETLRFVPSLTQSLSRYVGSRPVPTVSPYPIGSILTMQRA